MEETVRRAVERAITTMRANLGEPLTIEDLARSAMFSKFHFCRIFRQATGTSPARFLSALRLAEAKRLLRSTSMTVTRICHQVGYSSVGTFSTQFNLRVGTAPNSYRHHGSFSPITQNAEPGTTVRGNIIAPYGIPSGPIFVGLFRTRIPEGKPVRCTVLDAPGPYALAGVPEGDWQLLAHLIEPADVPYIGWRGAIAVRPDLTARLADIAMRPMRWFDPPVLIALPQQRVAPAGSGQLAVSAG
jgi:AraC-like DNA-binding protein